MWSVAWRHKGGLRSLPWTRPLGSTRKVSEISDYIGEALRDTKDGYVRGILSSPSLPYLSRHATLLFATIQNRQWVILGEPGAISRAGRKVGATKVFQARAPEPLGTDSHTVKRMLTPDWAPKCFVLFCISWWGTLQLIESEMFSDSSVVPSFLVRRVENESFPCMHNLDERTRQVWRENSRRVRTYEKNSRCCLPIGQNNIKPFLCPIRSQHSLDRLEMVRWESVPRSSSVDWCEGDGTFGGRKRRCFRYTQNYLRFSFI